MQRIGPVICRELHLGAVEHEARAGDAVGIAPDGRAEELPAGEISLERLMTEHDVVAVSGGIRHQQCLQRCAIGDDARFQSIGGLQDDALDFGAVRQHTEAGTRRREERTARSCLVLEWLDDAASPQQERVGDELERREIDVGSRRFTASSRKRR